MTEAFVFFVAALFAVLVVLDLDASR